MEKHFCDICGKPLGGTDYSRYRIKKEWSSWYETGWTRLEVHDECWRDICEIVEAKMNEREKEDD